MPLITITRQLAKQVHDVVRRGLPKPVRLDSLAVTIETGAEGLRLRSWLPTATIEYWQSGKLAPEQLTAPLDAFKSCAGTRPESVTIEQAEDNQIVFRWNDQGIPQVMSFCPP